MALTSPLNNHPQIGTCNVEISMECSNVAACMLPHCVYSMWQHACSHIAALVFDVPMSYTLLLIIPSMAIDSLVSYMND